MRCRGRLGRSDGPRALVPLGAAGRVDAERIASRLLPQSFKSWAQSPRAQKWLAFSDRFEAKPLLQINVVNEIEADWREFTGGPPVIGVLREYMPADVEGLFWRDAVSGRIGVVTWWVAGDQAEITSVHAEPAGGGIGTRLMDAAEEELRRRGVKHALVATTNDNARALNFYVERGYRLVRLHLDAMDRVRAAKPGVPATGRNGVPLQDMWELEKTL